MTISSRRLPAWSAGLLLASALSAAWPAYSADQPATRSAKQATIPTDDAARAPHVPEAQLLASAIGHGAVLLKAGTARDLMRAALDFGLVRTQTGNAAASMERTGVAMRLEEEGGGGAPAADADGDARGSNLAGGYLGGDIDLRFNFDAWRYAYAVTQPGADGWPSRSLQFFDVQGHAVHKLFLTNEVAAGLFDKLAMDFRAPDQHPPVLADTAPPMPNASDVPPEKPDSAIDVKQFRQAWLALTDAGQLGAMLADFGVTRAQALRLAPPGMARQLNPLALRALLDEVARQQLAVTVLVGNTGVTQLYTGPITGVGTDGDALVAQAPGLRLRAGALRSGYVVRCAGVISVEFFGPDGEPALAFFSVRDRARPQAWPELTRGLPGL